MKINSVVRFIFTHHVLLIEHAKAYGALVSERIAFKVRSLKYSVVFALLMLLFGSIAAVLGSVGLMLWAALPADTFRSPWALVIAPLVPGVVAIWCGWMSRTRDVNVFDDLKQQVAEDIKLFREQNSV